ncbi:MAG: hypothetical protein QM626_02065 [Microbacterium sp.]|uniref:hypothetical protein n=1 Tax=Microbacterium sp. TaxID=51671 RepID=UPI0039E266DD
MSRARRAALCAVALPLLLAGCSQVAALAPVGGDAEAAARIATIDVLLAQGVELGEAPQCASTDETIRCTGTTADGEQIEAQATTAADSPLEVSIAGTTVFTGTVADVIGEASRPTPGSTP